MSGKPRPPDFQRQREQCLPLPPEQADDQKRDEIAVGIIVGRTAGTSIGFMHPQKQRRRVDVTQNGIAQKLKQRQPRRQQQKEKALVRQPPPAVPESCQKFKGGLSF